MQQYFIDDIITGDHVTIYGDDAHHMARVMRMNQGSCFICCAADGYCAKCKVQEIAPDRVVAFVIEWFKSSNELPVNVTIAQALPKGDKLDLVVQKGTELGACAFLPFQAERSIVHWDEKKCKKKAARLQKISKEAAEQSHRNYIPRVNVPISFQKLLADTHHYDVKIMADEEEAKKADKQSGLAAILHNKPIDQNFLIVIGPEGGFTKRETSMMKNHNFLASGLGPRILRTETASLYILAAISYHYE